MRMQLKSQDMMGMIILSCDSNGQGDDTILYLVQYFYALSGGK
jgi:hypothetical protein